MKKILLPFLGLVLSVGAHAQWVAQPISFQDPGSTLVYSLDALDANVAWASSYNLVESDQGAFLAPGYEYARTTNGGTTWTTAEVTPLSDSEYVTSIRGISATTAYACVYDNQTVTKARLVRTTDGGATWATALEFSSAASYPNFVYFFNANEGICAGDPTTRLGEFEIYTTTNGGTTWTRAANPASVGAAPAPREVGTEEAPVAIGNSIWFSTSQGRIYRSTDKGLTWNVSTTGLSRSPQGLAFRDATNGLALFIAQTGRNHTLLRTADAGATWSQVTYTGPLHGFDLGRVPGNDNYISVGIGDASQGANNDAGSSFSRDNGQTWIPLESTLNHVVVDAVSPTVAWSGALGPGVYKLTSTVLSTRNDVAVQQGLTVYPNPSSDGHFTIQAGTVRPGTQVRVLDALGRQVYEQPWQGSAATPFALDLKQASAGMYTLELASEVGVARRKLVVR